jgi:hypothetical protein
LPYSQLTDFIGTGIRWLFLTVLRSFKMLAVHSFVPHGEANGGQQIFVSGVFVDETVDMGFSCFGGKNIIRQ